MKQNIKVNLCEYDIESIITFDFSFDLLKKLLVSMCTKNEQLGSKVSELADKIEDLRKVNDYDKKSTKEMREKLEKRIKSLENKIKSGTNKNAMTKMKDKPEGDNNGNDNNNGNESDSSSSSMSLLLSNEGADININQMNEIMSRIDEIDMKMKSYTPLSEVNVITTKQNEFLNRIKGFEMSLHNLRLKVNEFDIKDLFKGAKLESGNIDAAQLLFLNYENQTKEKFAMIDISQNQMNSEIQSLISDSVNKNKLASLNDQMQSLMKYNKDIDSKLLQIQKAINISNLGSGLIIPPIEDEQHKEFQEQNSIVLPVDNSEQKKAIMVLNKKIKDIDRAIRKLTTAFDPDAMVSDVKNLKEMIEQKGTKSDVAHLKDSVNTIERQSLDLQNSIQKHDDEFKKVSSSMTVLMKKIEGFQSSVIGVKNTYDSIRKTSKCSTDENGKYMETSLFNGFIKVFNREVDRLRKDYDDLSKKTDSMMSDMKIKATDSELKSVEEYLNTKMDEFKLTAHKKFADKIDVNRSFKYFDMQIKQFFDVSVKSSNDKGGDNWLLAKKPVGGYSCASCESYLGDLQEKKEYIPWNKFALRGETVFDQTMRTGNGFSHILNMLNIDSNKSGNALKIGHDPNRIYESDGEVMNSKSNEARHRKLPKLQSNRSAVEINVHQSDDFPKTPLGNNNQVIKEICVEDKDNQTNKNPFEGDQPKLYIINIYNIY